MLPFTGPSVVDINCTPFLDNTIEVPSSKVAVEPMIDPCPAHCIDRIGRLALVPQPEAVSMPLNTAIVWPLDFSGNPLK